MTDKTYYGYSLNQEQIEVAAGEILTDIGRRVEMGSGVWLGCIDVQNGLIHAMKEIEAERAIILWNPRNGIDVAPNGLFDLWARHLNDIAGSGEQVTAKALRQAVSAALMAAYGLGGGSLLVYREGWRLMVHPLAYDHAAPVIKAVTGLDKLPGVN